MWTLALFPMFLLCVFTKILHLLAALWARLNAARSRKVTRGHSAVSVSVSVSVSDRDHLHRCEHPPPLCCFQTPTRGPLPSARLSDSSIRLWSVALFHRNAPSFKSFEEKVGTLKVTDWRQESQPQALGTRLTQCRCGLISKCSLLILSLACEKAQLWCGKDLICRQSNWLVTSWEMM